MKKLWATLLCALLISALLGAMATDALPGDEAGAVLALEAYEATQPDDAVETEAEAPGAPVDTIAPDEPPMLDASESTAETAEVPQDDPTDEADVIAAETVDEAVEEAPDTEMLGEVGVMEIVAEEVVSDEPLSISYSSSEFTISGSELTRYRGSGGDVVIPDGITSIKDGAFSSKSNVTSVVIPESVVSIGSEAFYKCGMTSITIPESVTSIGASAFAKSGLTEIDFPDSLTAIPSYVCNGCKSLTRVMLPSEITSIDEGAFNDCILLKSIDIPAKVTSIGKHAFEGCVSLTEVTISEGVTSIGEYAYAGCSSLTGVTIPASVNSIGSYAFRNCTGLTSIEIPASITVINSHTFAGCTGLASVSLPEGLALIDNGAFDGCTGLKSLVIPASVMKINNSAFQKCTGLTSVTLKSSLSKDAKPGISYASTAFGASTAVFHVVCETTASQWATRLRYTVEKTSHVEETLPAVAATTEKAGLTEGKKCTVCGIVTVPQQKIPKITTPRPSRSPSQATTPSPSPSPTPKPTSTPKPVVTVIRVSKSTTKKVYVGSTIQIDCRKTVMGYSSSKPSVASVSSSGLITTHRAGTTKITIKIMGSRRRKEKAVLTLKVLDPSAPTKVSITRGKSVALKVGQTLQLNASLTPKTAKTTLTWKSSKKAVVTVDANGVITARKKGTAVITVTTGNRKKASIKVKVK